MNTYHWIEKENQLLAHNYHPIPVVLTKGEGVWLWDIENKRYLDMMSAYSAVSHGHCHPELIQVLQQQSQQLCVCSRAFHSDQLLPLAEKLCQISGLDAILPMNTGAEAVETAVKAARRWGYQVKGIPKDKAEIIVMKDNFHGRTVTITSFSTEEAYRDGFGPFTPGFKVVPFGDIEALKQAITPNTCAILAEPMQGEAGVLIPPVGYLKAVREVSQANRVLLLLDEIQTGLGRTGKWFAYQHEHIQPDGVIVGKALGGGILPVSAFIAKKELMSVFTPGSHGSTFGGNPLACRIARHALEIMERDQYVENSAVLGEYLLAGLKSIESKAIQAIRGKGLWIGLEINPKVIPARTVCEKLMQQGILSKEAHETVIRFAPPLIIDKSTLDWALGRIKDTFAILGSKAA
jgi:ornithine--oxo-acid transaminase